MFARHLFSFLFLFISFQIFSQEEDLLKANTIPSELKQNADAVVRFDNIHITVKAYDKMVYNNKRIVTILNEEGDSKDGIFQHYDKNKNIKKLEAKIYDANGNEIKKIKKNDFEDVSAVPGGTLYSDNRVKYLRYTPINYPYTIVFETEVEYSSTAFIPSWRVIEGFYTSTQNAEYKITNDSGVQVKVKTTNFKDYNIEKQSDYHYIAKDLKAIKHEAYSPSFKSYAPFLKAALTEFDMEGVKGVNNTWQDFGKWMDEELISDTQNLPQAAKDEIKALTANVETNIEKAKIVYKYMQNKTRYISVQVGIGGWKPMYANDVDRLGYGDCKALSNYTKALLNEVGVESYYTVVYGGKDIRSIDKEFSVTEGNHVILSVPNNEDYIWLECTSQTVPFGYNANFTDDRDALIITPEGGKIVHTKIYNAEENLQETKAKVTIDKGGSLLADVEIQTQGTQYDYHDNVQNEEEKDQKLHYKEYWDNINNLDVISMSFNNDKDNVVFTESIKVSAAEYITEIGDVILLEPNIFNKVSTTPPRYRNRKLPFEIDRGFVDIDEFEIVIPNTLQIETLSKDVQIKNKFGEYSSSIQKKANTENVLIFKRKFKLNKGTFNKEDYKAFREFRLQIVKYDKSKITLKKK